MQSASGMNTLPPWLDGETRILVKDVMERTL